MNRDKITILHLIKSLGRGGAEMLLPETIRVHHSEQFQFHCIYFLPWKNQMVSALEETGTKVTCMKANNNLQMLMKIPAIVRYCKANSIDLIHCHLPWAGFVGRFVHRISGIPVIYTEHNKQERYNRITFRLNKLTFNWQNAAIAVSGDVAASIKGNIGPSIPVQTVLNGVNTQKFQRNTDAGLRIRESHGIPKDAILIGTLAVFRFQKRLVEWLEVMKKITDKYPNVRGVIVGDGPLKAELIAKRKELGLEEKVLMPGLQINTVDWYSAMDIFMMSSVFEGLPIALLEAMSCACAVVTTDAGGIKEVVRPDLDGLMCTVDEWQQLETLASKLVELPGLKESLGSAARARVVESFSLDAMVNELETIYTNQTSTA